MTTYFTARSNLVPYAFVSGKVGTMGFSETIVVYDIKVGRWSQLNEYMKLYEYQRSRSFIDLGPSHSDSIFSNFFSSITSRPVEAEFHVALPRDEGIEVSSNGESKADDLETCYAAFGTEVLPNLSKWWPWVHLDTFYSNFNFGPFCLENHLYCRLLETDEFYEVKVGTCRQINEDMTICDYSRSRSFIDLCPRSLRFNIFKLFFSETAKPIGDQISYGASMGCGERKFVQMFQIIWPCPYMVKNFKRQGQICFLMLLHGWTLIQHWVLMYFQVCSNSTCPHHLDELYRTIVLWYMY